MTLSSLRALTRKELTTLAKKHRIDGWHEMSKDELVAALAVRLRRRVSNGREIRGRRESSPSEAARVRENGTTVRQAEAKTARRPLGGGHLKGRRLLKPSIAATAPAGVRDALKAEAHGPCWLHLRWTLSRETLSRAEAALGVQWHRALPVLRLLDVTADEAASSSQVRVRDVEIHGDVDHWYLPVEHAPHTYTVQLGYGVPNGPFFVMAQSNRVQTPRPESYSLRSRAG